MKLKIFKLNFIEFLFFLIFLLMLFSGYISKCFSYFTYIDDVCMVLIVLFTIVKCIICSKSIKLNRKKIAIFTLICFLMTIGIYGNYISKFQPNKFAILVDLLDWQKILLSYMCFSILIKDTKANNYYNLAISICKIIILVSLIFAILNLFNIINLTPGYERFGLNTFSLGDHPSNTASLFAIIISLLLLEKENNKIWIVIALVLESLTFRFKALGFSICVILAIIFMKKKISLYKVLAMGIIIIALSWNQISFYFFSSTASRAIALRTSFNIAKDYFPVGIGLASFGTSISGRYYSKAYSTYNLNLKYGFGPNEFSRVGDGGWATVIATFGFFGTIIYLIILYILYSDITETLTKKSQSMLSCFAILVYLAISSTNECIFTTPLGPIFMFSICTMLKYQSFKEVNNNQVIEKNIKL